MKKQFNRAVDTIIHALGSPFALLVAAVVIVVWAVTGPIFGFSDTWQLVINTGTTIVTFLMVFVIQNSQNRDSKAIHIKLDELIRANGSARNRMALAELETEEEQDRDIQELMKTVHKAERGSEGAAAAAGEITTIAASKSRSPSRSQSRTRRPRSRSTTKTT